MGGKQTNYVYTTDFTNGQASQVARHVLHLAAGALSAHQATIVRQGVALRLEGQGNEVDPLGDVKSELLRRSAVLRGSAGIQATSAALRQPPTSSPRLDAIILQEQLDREMRE